MRLAAPCYGERCRRARGSAESRNKGRQGRASGAIGVGVQTAVGGVLEAVGLNPILQSPGQPFDPRRGVAALSLHNQIKAFFGDGADVLREQGDAKGAARLA